MSTTSTMLRSAPISSSPVVQVAIVIESLARAYNAHRAFRKARAQLMALDDRMLKDIGIDRSEIASALLNEKSERRNGVAHPPMTRPVL